MASNAGTRGAATYSYSSGSGSYAAAVAKHQLTRQRTALIPAFAPCGGGGGGGGGYEWPGSPPPVARAAAAGGGVGAAARALWAWIGRRKKAVNMMSRSASMKKERLYGQDEYAQNFDEGAAAAPGEEAENLSRSFSARYARRASPPWDGAR
ncbi:hypothetical protein HU200_006319 [Digitaria exilis]|uniref:Uncharacterized protein n=1 Tax=Digitaria exilis TaxID=1010633 RepID=A0A835FPD3_9POAL|nr:hypothetical protein HU200_006319 [Digitaria exilis]CAB3446077.1 unnamed protein product [Digitaria exilis]